MHSNGEGDRLTDTQRAILDALSRPLEEQGAYASPATNQEIADEVFLSVDAVKGHLRALYAKLGLEDLPQNRKRARLAEINLSGALGGGVLPAAAPRPPARGGTARRGAVSTAVAVAGLALMSLLAVAGTGPRLPQDRPMPATPPSPAPEAQSGGEGDFDDVDDGRGTFSADLEEPVEESWGDAGGVSGDPSPAVLETAPVATELAPEPGPKAKSRRPAAPPRRTRPAAGRPAAPPAAQAPATAQGPCVMRRQVAYSPRVTYERRVRIHKHVSYERRVRYRTEYRMVPRQMYIPAGQRHRHLDGSWRQHRRARTETVLVRQKRRVREVDRVRVVRRHPHVRRVRVVRRQRVVRTVRECG